MKCESVRENFVDVAEGCAMQPISEAVDAHLRECPACCAEMDQLAAVRQSLFAAAQATRAGDLEERVMRRVRNENAHEAGAYAKESPLIPFWTSMVTSRGLRLSMAGLVVIVALVSAAILFYTPSQAWSIERSIAATRQFRAIYLAGTIDGHQECEMWIRARPDHSQMRDMRLRVGNLLVWVKDNYTFFYAPGSRVVYTDDAQTAGFEPWPGSELLEWIRAAGISRVTYALDFTTGHRKAIAESSFTDMHGPKSFVLEFDTSSNLLLSLRQWTNLQRAGTPSFESRKIEYFEDLPDEIMTVELPPHVAFQPKELNVAAEALGLLTLSQYGISTQGLTEEEASRRIVKEMWEATIREDWTRFRQLCPAAANWTDDALRVLVGGANGQDAVVEVLEIGSAIRRGRSRIGPLMVVPSRVKHRDGNTYEQKMIVQIRPSEGASSCVVYGPYGTAFRLD